MKWRSLHHRAEEAQLGKESKVDAGTQKVLPITPYIIPI